MRDDGKLPLLGRIRTLIASPPDRENVVWELRVNDKQLAEVCYEGGEMSLEIFWLVGQQEALRVSLDEFLAALTAAKEDFVRTHGL